MDKYLITFAIAFASLFAFGHGWTQLFKKTAAEAVNMAESTRKLLGSDTNGAMPLDSDEPNTLAKCEVKTNEQESVISDGASHDLPEDFIAQNRVMSPSAIGIVIREMTFTSNTDNKIYDEEMEIKHRSRFSGKRIAVSGMVEKVTTTLFGGDVKVIVSVNGGTISARFDGMSRSDAAQFRSGRQITFEGIVSTRMVFSSIAMDCCVIRNVE